MCIEYLPAGVNNKRTANIRGSFEVTAVELS